MSENEFIRMAKAKIKAAEDRKGVVRFRVFRGWGKSTSRFTVQQLRELSNLNRSKSR